MQIAMANTSPPLLYVLIQFDRVHTQQNSDTMEVTKNSLVVHQSYLTLLYLGTDAMQF